MNRRIILLSSVLIIIAAVALIVPRFVFQKPTSKQETTKETTMGGTSNIAFPLSTDVIGTLKTQAEKEFDFAFSKAREWRQDTVFYGAAIKYKGGVALENGKNTYIFFSPSLPLYYWTLTLDQAKNAKGENNFERIIYYKEDYFLPEKSEPIPMQYWKLNYLDALTKADETGGKEIRGKYNDYDVNILLSDQVEKDLAWYVEYVVDSKSMLLATFNAFSGEAM